MKINCKKIGCRKSFFSREELRDHVAKDHRPATAPVLEAKPQSRDTKFTAEFQEHQDKNESFVSTSNPERVKHLCHGPFVFVIADKGLVITHSSGDSALMSWTLLQRGLLK